MDVDRWGLRQFADLFTPRQMFCLMAFIGAIQEAEQRMRVACLEDRRFQAVVSYLGFVVDRLADWNSSLCSWSPAKTGGAKIGHTFGRQAFPMVWDFVESAVWGNATGSATLCLNWVVKGLMKAETATVAACVSRGSATDQPYSGEALDAVITDPPYYDNVSYSNLSDFFYIWLKRIVGHLYPEHFATKLTPKKSEAIAAFYRHHGSKAAARTAYEDMMAQSLTEAHRTLKPSGTLAVVYAHKTTLGWSTLVDALRRAGFVIVEAWPLSTEMKSRLVAMDTAALASSIFLVGRKRDLEVGIGNYEDEVQPELNTIVRERVNTLWQQGISGADLVIAAVGAGLRAFTRFERVEYANGEEVPAEEFLAEVEGVVLEALLEKIFGISKSGVAAVDGPSRFYTLWRFTYKNMVVDAGEAIVFTYGQPVELDGHNGLSSGSNPLLEKQKGKYRMRDFTDRGKNEKLGLPRDDGTPAPLIDVLHRILWLIEYAPRQLNHYLDQVSPDQDRLRLVAQALAGAALSGKSKEDAEGLIATTTAEQAALGKLLANWNSLIERRLKSGGVLFDK